jgi:hypothetical protein
MTTHRLVIREFVSTFRQFLEWYGRSKYKEDFSIYQVSTGDGNIHLVVRTPAGWMEFELDAYLDSDYNERLAITLSYDNVDDEFRGYAEDFIQAIRDNSEVE